MVTVRNKLTGTTTSYSGGGTKKSFNPVGVSVGGKNSVVDKGSEDYRNLIAQGGVESSSALASRNAELKGLNKGKDKGTPSLGVPTNISNPEATTKAIPQATPTEQDIVNFDAKTRQPLAPGQSTTDALGNTSTQGNKFKEAHAQLKGMEAPADAGQGKMLAGQALNQVAPPEPDMSVVDDFIMQDKGTQELATKYKEYFDPENQKSSLLDTYNKLYKKSGIQQLDEEIIDAQTIIDGTEDDIRNEVEQAGGFATDSQVQALALSRNKILLKNYNNLVALRESKSQHLDTMLNFAEKDRAYADQQIDRMFNYDMQMNSLREKFIQNSRDQYNRYEPAQLQAMLANNPRQLAFAEDIMGLGRGGLAKLASVKTTAQKLDEAQLYGQQLQNQKLKQELNTPIQKPLTQAQIVAKGYATRTVEANNVIKELGSKFSKTPEINLPFGMGNLTALKTSDRKRYNQAKQDFINAVLRPESGAAISPSEFDNADRQYFPQLGDTSEVILQKEQNRNTKIASLLQQAGENLDPSKLTVSPTGELIQIID